jgi:GMP synthase (glutamine-hydrolysing)
MRILIVENLRGTSLGQVEVALSEAGAEQVWIRPWNEEALPSDSDGFHGMVVLGGEQSAIDDELHPYLPDLARLMKRFGDDEKAVLGICLGSQLLARAHGGINILGQAREFGWHRVVLTETGRTDPVFAAIDSDFPIFEWHSDTFTLPGGRSIPHIMTRWPTNASESAGHPTACNFISRRAARWSNPGIVISRPLSSA